MTGVVDDQRVWTRRRLLLVVALTAIVAVLTPSVGSALLSAWQGRDDHDCVPPAADSLYGVPRAGPPRDYDVERDPPASDEGGCLARSSYSIRSRQGETIALAFSYERFDAHWNEGGASVASRRLAEQRPRDAVEVNLPMEVEEGYVVSDELGGRSSVELPLRDRNVLVTVTYLGALPLPSATNLAQRVAQTMLEEVQDLNFPTG